MHETDTTPCGDEMPRGVIWEEGNVYGRLTVWQLASTSSRRATWHCQCDCGNLRVVSGSDLRAGNVKSCGRCYSPEETLYGTVQELSAPCDRECHFRGRCMSEKLACWPFQTWVDAGVVLKPDPESYPPNSAIYKRLFKGDKQQNEG